MPPAHTRCGGEGGRRGPGGQDQEGGVGRGPSPERSRRPHHRLQLSRRKGSPGSFGSPPTRQGHWARGRQRAPCRSSSGGQRHPGGRGGGALSSGLGPQGGQAGHEGRWAWAGAPRAPEGSVPSAPACWACLTLQTAPAAAALGLRVQAGGRARGRQPPPAHLSTHVHTDRPAVWWEMRTGGRWAPGGPAAPPRPHPAPLTCAPRAGLQAAGRPLLGGPRTGSTSILGWGVHAPPLATPMAAPTRDAAGSPSLPHCPGPSHCREGRKETVDQRQHSGEEVAEERAARTAARGRPRECPGTQLSQDTSPRWETWAKISRCLLR